MAIPVILFIFTGLIFLFCYLMWTDKIKITVGVCVLLVLAIVCFGSCRYCYNVLEQRRITTEIQDQKKLSLLNENKVDALRGYAAPALEKDILTSPGTTMPNLLGKVFPVHEMYFLSSMEREGDMVYVFSSVPGGNLDKEKSILFFCATANPDIKAECAKLTPVKPASLILEFVGVQEGPENNGRKVIILMSVIRSISF